MKQTLRCLVCGWQWVSRTKYPIRCPAFGCNSPDWDGPDTQRKAREVRARAQKGRKEQRE